MSFVTAACGGAAGGSATPPEPCPHNGAATIEAMTMVAHQRAQCVIPTSIEDCGGGLSPPPRESDVHAVPAGGGPGTPPPRRGAPRTPPRNVEHHVELHQPAAPH